MEHESTEAVTMGLEATLAGMLLATVAIALFFANSWYGKERARQDEQYVITRRAEEYNLIHRDTIEGVDIVDYIVKNGSLYDYTIYTTSAIPVSITKMRARSMYERGDNGGLIYTEEYLTGMVFFQWINYKFIVEPTYVNEEVVAYTFTMIIPGGGT